MEPTPCSRCGTFIRERSELLYSDEGEPMCAACRKKLDEPVTRRATTNPIIWRALGAAFWAVVGFPVALLFFAGALFGSVPALTAGLVVLGQLRSEPELRARLGGRYRLVWISAWIGVVFGALGCLAVIANVVVLRLAR